MSQQSAATAASPGAVPSRVARKLTATDAVVMGLGAMVGAGIFAVIGPAVAIAGSGALVALLLAALVAYCNATPSAQLAALYPESGGAYVYGRRRLGPFLGYLAGWGFVVGKLASCTAMALTFASYAAPALMRPLAVAAVLAITAVNLLVDWGPGMGALSFCASSPMYHHALHPLHQKRVNARRMGRGLREAPRGR